LGWSSNRRCRLSCRGGFGVGGNHGVKLLSRSGWGACAYGAIGYGHGDDWLAHLNGVALVGQQLGDGSGEGTWQFHQRLRGLNLANDLVYANGVAGLDHPGNNLGLG
jgi:hypothetical protein